MPDSWDANLEPRGYCAIRTRDSLGFGWTGLHAHARAIQRPYSAKRLSGGGVSKNFPAHSDTASEAGSARHACSSSGTDIHLWLVAGASAPSTRSAAVRPESAASPSTAHRGSRLRAGPAAHPHRAPRSAPPRPSPAQARREAAHRSITLVRAGAHGRARRAQESGLAQTVDGRIQPDAPAREPVPLHLSDRERENLKDSFFINALDQIDRSKVEIR
jgi:hypothetical protein